MEDDENGRRVPDVEAEVGLEIDVLEVPATVEAAAEATGVESRAEPIASPRVIIWTCIRHLINSIGVLSASASFPIYLSRSACSASTVPRSEELWRTKFSSDRAQAQWIRDRRMTSA